MHNIRKYRNKDNIGPMPGESRTAREEEEKMLGRKKEEISLKRNKGKNQHSKCSVLCSIIYGIYLMHPHRRSKGANN